jgi:hypothetical protein
MGTRRADLRWSHDVPLGKTREDGPTLTFGVEAFNVLNTVNANGYVGTMSSPFFGQATSSQPAHQLQLSLSGAGLHAVTVSRGRADGTIDDLGVAGSTGVLGMFRKSSVSRRALGC